MSLIDVLTHGDDAQDSTLAIQRVTPLQPDNGELGHVYLGEDLGWVRWNGHEPEAGDLVVVVGDERGRIALTAAPQQPLHQPIFTPAGCRCKCPDSGGTAFYMAAAARSSAILAVNVATTSLYQLFGLGDLWFGRGIGVDLETPFPLYILDDRRVLRKRRTVVSPSLGRGYFSIVTFSVQSGAYVATGRTFLTDPFPTPSTEIDYPDISLESQETDPPNFTTNGLSVVDGLPHLTLYNSPARYLTLTAGTLTTHTLTRDGVTYARGLRGNIITIPDKPVSKSKRYVIGYNSADNSYELIEFDDTRAVSRVLALDNDPKPRQLASVCNQLLILNSNTDPFVPTGEFSP